MRGEERGVHHRERERERERAPKNKPLMHAGGRGMRESGGGGVFKFRVRAMLVPD